jgi:hypothetical protein
MVLVGAEVDVAAVGLDVIVDEADILKEWRLIKRLIEREAEGGGKRQPRSP